MKLKKSTLLIFLLFVTNSVYGQDCNSVEIEKDPFTKEITATSELISPHRNLHFGYRLKDSDSYLRVNYRKDIGYAIGYGKQADLPTIDRNTNFWVLFEDGTVLKVNYVGNRVTAKDPRNEDGPVDATKMLIMGIQNDPRDDRGRIKSYYVSATANFLLNNSEVSHLKNKSISKVRIERLDTEIDADVRKNNFIKNVINCTE